MSGVSLSVIGSLVFAREVVHLVRNAENDLYGANEYVLSGSAAAVLAGVALVASGIRSIRNR